MSDNEALDNEADDAKTAFDRSRSDYTGVELGDEFQPVDEVELAEEDMQLDDPEKPGGRRAKLDPDDVGWDLDE
jgi:hypothetical protein